MLTTIGELLDVHRPLIFIADHHSQLSLFQQPVGVSLERLRCFIRRPTGAPERSRAT